MKIRAGDFVQLESRDAPFNDPKGWWWQVLGGDRFSGYDCVHEITPRHHVNRLGVGHNRVMRVRHKDQPVVSMSACELCRQNLHHACEGRGCGCCGAAA